MKKDHRDLSEILFNLGEDHVAWQGSISPPIYQSSNFRLSSFNDLREAFSDEVHAQLYSRGNNPTQKPLKQKLAALESADDALLFSSGMAAISAVILHCLKAGSHAICVQNPYPWTQWLFTEYLNDWDVEVDFVDGRELKNFENALRDNTALIYLESPNSFTFDLQDIAAVCELAKSRNIPVAIDNSCCSPLLQKPLELGADWVMHSASKYLSGHSDLVAGVVCSSQENINSLFTAEFQGLGGILGAQESWLILRGLRTLEIRMQRIRESTSWLVNRLVDHPRVKKIFYPGHPSHPQYELAQRQMKGAAGQWSMILDVESEDQVARFCESLEFFRMAVSWGGFESLIIPAAAKRGNTLDMGLVRCCAGLEDPQLLWEDLQHALGTL
jgi:cystathionine beta-lyase/cystathionine gamma-synthase